MGTVSSNNRQSDYKTTLSPTSQSRTAGTHNHPLLAVLLPSSELDPPTIPSPRHQTTRHKPAPYTPSLDRHPDTSFRSDWSDIRAEDSVSCREIGQLFKNNEEKEEEGDDGILKLLECVHLALGDESVQQSRGTEGYGQSGKILNDSMGATPQYHAATKHPASRESTPRHGSSLDTNLSRPYSS
ncbi:hypothetical protein BC829DRAFT_228745 [Chytridium lagenaria]|nr:hypothetical protein BC829DRAFT_228745 [Chytridium lagenaria]